MPIQFMPSSAPNGIPTGLKNSNYLRFYVALWQDEQPISIAQTDIVLQGCPFILSVYSLVNTVRIVFIRRCESTWEIVYERKTVSKNTLKVIQNFKLLHKTCCS